MLVLVPSVGMVSVTPVARATCMVVAALLKLFGVIKTEYVPGARLVTLAVALLPLSACPFMTVVPVGPTMVNKTFCVLGDMLTEPR